MKRREWLLKKQHEQWHSLWQGAAAWGSVPPTEDWRRPFRIMGVFDLEDKASRDYPPPPPPRTFPCWIEHETEKAWLAIIDGRNYWLPKSRCKLNDDGDRITVEDWLWRQKQNEQEEENK